MRFRIAASSAQFHLLALACLGISILSSFQKLGWFSFGDSTHLKIVNGVAESSIHLRQTRANIGRAIPNRPGVSHRHSKFADAVGVEFLLEPAHRLGRRLGCASPRRLLDAADPDLDTTHCVLCDLGLAVGFRRSR